MADDKPEYDFRESFPPITEELLQELPLNLLENLAYRLQIPYRIPLDNSQRGKISAQIIWIRDNQEDDDEAIERRISERKADRMEKGIDCNNLTTSISLEDVSLYSDEQLYFLESQQGEKKVTFCLGKDDASDVIENRRNPWTGAKMSKAEVDRVKELAKMDPYPKFEVGTYFEEYEKIFKGNKVVTYVEPAYKSKTRRLDEIIRGIGMNYVADILPRFFSSLTEKQFNIMLTHNSINIKLSNVSSRDDAASQTLQILLNFYDTRVQSGRGGETALELALIIEEVDYYFSNDVTYLELVEQKGRHHFENGAKELIWKPNFLREEYHSSGQVKERYYVDFDGVRYGEHTFYSRNGNILHVATYGEGGKKEGLWKKFNHRDIVIRETPYVDGKRDGVEKKYNYKGVLLQETVYVDDKRNGVERHYNYKGILDREATYVDDKKNGVKREYDSDGLLLREATYVDDKKNGVEREYGRNGVLIRETPYEEDKKNGVEKKYDRDGALVGEITFVNGERNGAEREYDKGVLITETPFVNSQKNGVEKKYYNDGILIRETPFVNNQKNGVERHYVFNGLLVRETPYVKDEKNGVEKKYGHNGVLIRETPYVDDAIQGVVKEYNDKGVLVRETPYDDDAIQGVVKEYNDKGVLVRETPYVDDAIQGVVKEYNDKGVLVRETPYVRNKKNGVEKRYNNDGVLIEETPCVNGKKNGVKKRYNNDGVLISSILYVNGKKNDSDRPRRSNRGF